MKTATSSFFNDQTVFLTTKQLLRWTICSLIPIAMFLIYFYDLPILPFSPSPNSDFTHSNITSHHSSPSSSYAGISLHNSFLIIKTIQLLLDFIFVLTG